MNGLVIMTGEIEEKISYGGQLINKRNLKILDGSCDRMDVILLKKMPRKFKALYDIIMYKNFYGITNKKKKYIFDKIKKNHYDFCFISASLGGILAYEIKKYFPRQKVIVFFHNVEYIFFLQLAKQTGFYKRILAFSARMNEKMAIKYADKIISLNKRDAIEIKNLYNRNVDFILPTTFDDKYKNNINLNYNKNNNTKKVLLFVGSNFYANFHGISWFIENVLEYLDNVILYIVGKGTEDWKKIFENVNNLNIIGSVDDLGKYYALADIVVSPIFLGSGMKTKTAEALMYGKYIFGTKEAFEGYDVDFEKVGGLCNDRDEFVKKINKHLKIVNDNYNKYSRNIFLEKYDTKKWIMIMKKFLNEK